MSAALRSIENTVRLDIIELIIRKDCHCILQYIGRKNSIPFLPNDEKRYKTGKKKYHPNVMKSFPLHSPISAVALLSDRYKKFEFEI